MIKWLIDRSIPSKAAIENRQDFEKILKQIPSRYTFNSPWFYGAIGFSSILIFAILISFL
ncbi:MAG: hypothetical protein EBS17_03915 [Flavobacteriia bacterium]|nr:hypothetical protein [Flavobacteriia bacterium]